MAIRGTFAMSASRRTLVASVAASLLLSAGTADFAWSREVSWHWPWQKPTAAAKPHKQRLAALPPKHEMAKPASQHEVPKSVSAKLFPLSPPAGRCVPSKFRIVLDVGHTAESEGAISARNVPEFDFNLHLAQQIEEKLKAEGFAETRLLVTGGKARPSLFKRVAAANDLGANLFLSIHHDSVPDRLLENWEFGGRKSHFSDRFSGYSVFVSHANPDFATSLQFAELIGKEMKAEGLQYAQQYTLPIMGRYQRKLLDKETGVYLYDDLVVLRKTRMPAVLLEAGSIINRDEELQMNSPERQNIISSGVTAAVKEFCDPRWAMLGPL